MSGEVIGNLCESLCLKETMESLACHPSKRQEGVAFSTTWKGKRILFKSPKIKDASTPKQLHWTDKNNIKQYPTYEEFLTLITRLVYSKMNLNISLEKAKEIGTIPLDDNFPTDKSIEMENAWMLLQDEDYLSTVLFSGKEIFPERVGTCGYLYATEYPEIAKGTSALFSLEDDEEEWDRRSHLAVLMQDLLVKLDKNNLQICDIQLKNFGALGNRLHYLSPGNVRLRKSLPKINPCKIDHDCGNFDCLALCNVTSGFCNKAIESDNLQLVCEKIYLGWKAAGRVIIPGLLVSTKASSALATLLRRCADPNALPHTKAFKMALYNTLLRKS